MALMMGMAMIVIMLGFMWGMYKSLATKIVVMAIAAVGFVLFLFLARNQQTVSDEAWMKAMIPHHSIAIQTSSKASITDPRVRKLADEIIEAQLREIAEMKMLIEDIENNGKLGDGSSLKPVPAVLTPGLQEKAEERVRSEGRNVTPEIRETVDVGE